MKISGLTYQFPKAATPIFQGLSFELLSPGVNFLIGQNGAGKTTLADVLTGLRPASGTIDLPRSALYINQHLPLLTSIRVEDVAQLILGVELGRFKLTFDELGSVVDSATLAFLQPIWHQRYGELSGGQRKLVQTLLFLQLKRELIVLDEPTAAVDRQNVELLFDVMARHPTCTYLMITHDVRDIAAVNDYRVLWLDQGQLTTMTPQVFQQTDRTAFITAFKTM